MEHYFHKMYPHTKSGQHVPVQDLMSVQDLKQMQYQQPIFVWFLSTAPFQFQIQRQTTSV